MTQKPEFAGQNRPAAGIAFIVVAFVAISLNDMLIKQLSGGYPLHQIVLIRSGIGIFFSLLLVQWEGGMSILRTATPGLHLLRGLLIVCSNMTYFVALAAIPLADATALFYVAPLMITLLSIPMLGEKVGPMRLGACAVGFLGVLVMVEPWAEAEARKAPLWILCLPVVAAFTYAMNQVLTRKLGAVSKASAMAVYIQATFIVVSAGFWIFAGDGRYAEGLESPSLIFLLRAWVLPEGIDVWLLTGLGMTSAIIGYCISQAYRLAEAATVAPFEYTGLPLAILWGWLIWGDLPGWEVLGGIILITGAGLFVFVREQQKKRHVVSGRRVHRRY